MATDNLGAELAGVELKTCDNGDTSQETRLHGWDRKNKFAIRTQMEKILLILAFVLLILCIVFIALLAKESSSDDDSSSSSSSTGGRSGKCDSFISSNLR